MIISTKVTPTQKKRLEEICNETQFGSLYEMMQAFLFSLLKLCDKEHEATEEQKETLRTVLEPFFEIENPADFIAGANKEYNRSSSGNTQRGEVDFVLIRNGGFASWYFKKNGEMKVSHNTDNAVLNLISAARPSLREPIRAIMAANKTRSFLECLRILVNDALEDARTTLKNDAQDYASVNYEPPAKQTRFTSEFESSINPYLLMRRRARNNPDVNRDFDDLD